MSTFKDRLLVEKGELNEKRLKLDNFICSDAFNKIDPIQKSLLRVQHSAMGTYSDCLTERIMGLDKSEGVSKDIDTSMAVSNGIPVDTDEKMEQVTVQGEIHIGPPL